MPAKKAFSCPVCGGDVPVKAKACPRCGSCDKTGWKKDAITAGLDLPDEEFGRPIQLRGWRRFWWWVTAILAMILIILIFSDVFLRL